MNVNSGGWYAALGIALSAVLFISTVVCLSCRDDKIFKMFIAPAVAWRLAIWSVVVIWLVPSYTASGVDAMVYYEHGCEIAEAIRSGSWDTGLFLGTESINVITGFLYVPFGASFNATYLFSAALGLAGAIYSYKAFALWQRGNQKKFYAAIIFFLPSFTLWTSIFGKDSWIALGLGLSSYGYSLWLKTRRKKALTVLAAGLLVTGIIRPHIAVMVTTAMLLTYGWIRTKERVGAFSKVLFALVLLLTSVGAYVALQRLLQVEDLSGLSDLQERSARGNAVGGSAIERSASSGVSGAIRGIPSGLVDVYLRPYPWAAHNVTVLLASIENMLILVLVCRVFRSLKNTLQRLRSEPYFVFCLLMTAQVSVFLTLATNLGLISRQKAMLTPFLLAFLIGPYTAKGARRLPLRCLPMRDSLGRTAFVPAGPGHEIGEVRYVRNRR